MNDDEISVQLYSVRDAVAADLSAALDRLAALGLRNVELYGFVDDAKRYAAALAAAGLTAPSAHAPLLGMADPARVLAAATECGVTTVIDPFFDPESWTTETGVVGIADRLNALSATAAGHGISVGYHNHAFELRARLGGKSALERLAELLDPAVVIEVDTFWAQVGGEPAPALLERLGERVRLIHVKDGPLTEVDEDQLPAGTGAMDVPAVLAAAPRALRVIEFDGYRGDPFDGIAASLAFLRDH